jgi:hypothetical protein
MGWRDVTATLSMWTSKPMKWITGFMGVWFHSGSGVALSSSVLCESNTDLLSFAEP